MEDKKSTYTEAQKKATKKYRENNKDKVKEQRKTYYQRRKDRDPGFLEYKRLNARKYYNRKKNKIMVVFIEQETEPEPLVVEEVKEPEKVEEVKEPEKVEEVKEPEKVEEVKFERYNFFEEPEKEEVKETDNKPSAKRKRVYRKK